MIRWLALAALSIALTACSGTQVRETVHKTASTAAAPAVRIDNAVGQVTVTGWQKNAIDIVAVKSATSEDALRNIDIDVRTQGNTVTIATQYHGSSNGGVRYAISVPVGASLDVENTTGAIHIEGVNGDVSATAQTGQVDASVGRVSDRRAIDLTATTGAVRLQIDPNSDARVEARTTVGDVRSDFDSIEPTRQNVVGASAAGSIGSGSATIHLRTTTGAVSLRRS